MATPLDTNLVITSPPFPPPSVDLMNLEVLDRTETERQKKIVKLREYYYGDQGAKVTDRLKEFMPSLASGFEFSLNFISVIIQAITEKLNVKGFDSEDAALIEWAEDVWTKNNMEAIQDDVHESALLEGEHFVIVSWDNEKRYPRWTPIETWTSSEVGGTDYGCRIFYPQGNTNLDPILAVKQWSEMDDEGKITDFRTVYYPDRIEKFQRTDTIEWQHRQDPDDEEWPIPWTDDEDQPLGIPVIHFQNKRGMSEVEDTMAPQDAINKSALDTLISSDQTAFRIYVSLGWIPTTDGQAPKEDRSNWAEIEPGTVIGTTKSKTEASFEAIEPPQESIRGLSEVTQTFIIWTALTTGTPVTRVITTKLIASDETLKQQEEPLNNKVALRRSILTKPWLQCFEMSRKLQLLYGDPGTTPDMKSVLSLIWGSRLHPSVEELKAMTEKKNLGIPEEQIWREMGYSSKLIARMKKMRAEAAKLTAGSSNTNEEAPDGGKGRQDQSQS